jgi:hypothetical protein
VVYHWIFSNTFNVLTKPSIYHNVFYNIIIHYDIIGIGITDYLYFFVKWNKMKQYIYWLTRLIIVIWLKFDTHSIGSSCYSFLQIPNITNNNHTRRRQKLFFFSNDKIKENFYFQDWLAIYQKRMNVPLLLFFAYIHITDYRYYDFDFGIRENYRLRAAEKMNIIWR